MPTRDGGNTGVQLRKASLKANGRDIGAILVEEELAVPFECGGTRCPRTPRPYAPAFAMLPAQVVVLITGAHQRQDALIAELYVGKITIGEFNIGMNRIKGEIASAFSGIPQSSESSQLTPSSTEPVTGNLVQHSSPPVVAQPVLRQARIALVIGNSSYLNLPKLSNPANDARAVADALTGMGFRTTFVLDTSEQDLRRTVRRFASESADADIGLVFYAGHGAQVNGENYVLPVDLEVARISRAN